MAGRLGNPVKLREQAQELLKKAKRIEEKKFRDAGQLVYEYYQNDFADFDEERFKSEVNALFLKNKKSKSEE